MKRFRTRLFTGMVIAVLLCIHHNGFAQADIKEAENQKLTATIIHLDSLFWKSYNECHTENSGQYLTDDVKFYHDKGGITNGKNALVESIRKNICGNPAQRIRREAVEGTVKVYPLRNGDSIYGAIITGEHYFYVTQSNKPESRDGLAKFAQVWLLQNNEWKMAEVLSYDHHTPPYISIKKEIILAAGELKKFEGNYKNPKFGTFNIKTEGPNLLMDGSGFHSILYAETKNMFFVKDRDLEFEFVTNEKRQVYKIIVHENGSVVDDLLRF